MYDNVTTVNVLQFVAGKLVRTVYLLIINNMLYTMKMLRSDWSKTFFFVHFTIKIFFTLPRPLPGDWLCMTLSATTCDVPFTLFIDKTNMREVSVVKKI